jgi:hypothetical protein
VRKDERSTNVNVRVGKMKGMVGCPEFSLLNDVVFAVGLLTQKPCE